MQLALRATPADGATLAQRAFAALTRWRLCSQWCHGGIVIGGTLYQANAAHGLHAAPSFSPEKWTLIELGDQHDARALELFMCRKGAGYDYLGVLGFGLPGIEGSDERLYCFEWCAMAMQIPAARWMTPERLLACAVSFYES